MTFEMVDADERAPERIGDAVGNAGADEEGPGQARALGIGDHVERGLVALRALQHLLQERQRALDVVARGELRHDSAVGLVHCHLRVQSVRQQPARPAVIERDARLVAGAFNS